MPIVKQPAVLPSALDYVPPNTTPYKVTNADSWYSLAERPEVKKANLSAIDLCYLNFKTRNPAEINWYLNKKVGCTITTKDGKNYRFSTGDSPGVVYLPSLGIPLPVNEFPPNPAKQTSGAWLGIGGKAGTMFVVVGIETMTGYVVSLDDMSKGMGVTASINRLGLGAGVTGGLCIIYMTGIQSPGDLNGYQQLDADFNLSLGGNWGKMAKTAKLAKLKPLIQAVMKVGARTPKAFQQALKAHPDKWVELVKAAKSSNEFMGIDPGGAPNVFVLDVPIGGGVEASVFYGLSNFNAVWDNSD
jgi:hypothetical protein